MKVSELTSKTQKVIKNIATKNNIQSEEVLSHFQKILSGQKVSIHLFS